jgi:arsenate reductase
MADHVYTVLFLCLRNSARSIIAESILNREGAGRFKAFSAGSRPTGEIHPYALDLLHKMNHSVAGLRSKSDAMSAHWGVPDPVLVEGTEAERRFAFAEAYRMLRNRIGIFVNLPLPTLDRLALQARLNEIGRNLPHTA